MTTHPQPGEVSTQGTCRACGATFDFHARYYAEKHLAPPRLCRECRGARAARLEPAIGRLVSRGPRFAIVACGNESFIAHGLPADVSLNAPVAFRYDPAERPAPGRLRIARGARVEE
jgi:hypothetical protein